VTRRLDVPVADRPLPDEAGGKAATRAGLDAGKPAVGADLDGVDDADVLESDG
jgi:hypothetical protein